MNGPILVNLCDTYFLDLATETYTQGPNMTVCRFGHSCDYVAATNEVVIAGGAQGGNSIDNLKPSPNPPNPILIMF